MTLRSLVCYRHRYQLRIIGSSSTESPVPWVGSHPRVRGPTLLLRSFEGLEVLGGGFCLPSQNLTLSLEDIVAGSKLCW